MVFAFAVNFVDLAGFIAAVLLAVVFAWAGFAKLRHRSSTEADFASLGLPQPRALATLVPPLEIGVAVLLVVLPGWGGVAAFALLAMFSAVLIGVIRSGRVVSCACFGGAASKPVDAKHLVRNAVLAVLALAATTVGEWSGDLLGLT